MELRETGIAVDEREERLRLPEALTSDVGDLRASGAKTLPGEPLEGLDHPEADELRRLLHQEFGGEATEPSKGESDLHAYLGRALVRLDPERAATMAAEAWNDMKYRAAPADLLEFLNGLLEAIAEDHPKRLPLLMHASWAADILTRYSLARRLLTEALHGAEIRQDHALTARALINLTTILTNERRWSEARNCVDRAVAAARRANDAVRLAGAHLNRANLRWRILDPEGAVEDYREAIRFAMGTVEQANIHLVACTHLNFLHLALGVEIGESPPMPMGEEATGGFAEILRNNSRFWIAFSRGERSDAVDAAVRVLDLTAEVETEAIFVYAIDYVACLFARMGETAEAAACVRVGTRLRRQIGSLRSPGERLLLSRHLPGAYFTPEAAALYRRWLSDEPRTVARRMANRLHEA